MLKPRYRLTAEALTRNPECVGLVGTLWGIEHGAAEIVWDGRDKSSWIREEDVELVEDRT